MRRMMFVQVTGPARAGRQVVRGASAMEREVRVDGEYGVSNDMSDGPLRHPHCGDGEQVSGNFLRHNRALDRRTEIRKSDIPGAGLGLFALQDIKEGEMIGEYGGSLVTEDNYPVDDRYVAFLPECALKKPGPYGYVDGMKSEAHVTRINFAPRRINGRETHLQNAAYAYNCRPPYMYFYATRDIKKGEEIYADYGSNYDYSFMNHGVVRTYFCGLLSIDCYARYDFEN